MEDRDEMLEAIAVIIESYSDEEIVHIFNTLTATVQQETRVMDSILYVLLYTYAGIGLVFALGFLLESFD